MTAAAAAAQPRRNLITKLSGSTSSSPHGHKHLFQRCPAAAAAAAAERHRNGRFSYIQAGHECNNSPLSAVMRTVAGCGFSLNENEAQHMPLSLSLSLWSSRSHCFKGTEAEPASGVCMWGQKPHKMRYKFRIPSVMREKYCAQEIDFEFWVYSFIFI